MLSRREFLRRTLLATLALASGDTLASCASAPTPTPVPPTVAPTQAPATITRVAAAPSAPVPMMTATPSAPAAGAPYLIVARGTTPGTLVRAALDELGGMKKFVKAGNDVILKPNICNAQNSFELASTTNPDVLAELVKLCLEAGAKRVRVMDQPFSGTAAEAYKRSGIRDAVEKAGGEMEVMSAAKYAAINFSAPARDLKSAKIYQDILKADVVINVPIAKHHGSAQVTLALKGLMGVIQDRNAIHTALDQRIADLATAIKPTLNVIDGIRVLTRNGPTGGRLDYVRQDNTLIVSHDPVAADAYAAQIFFNKKPETIGYLLAGAEMRLGRYDFANLRVKEVTA